MHRWSVDSAEINWTVSQHSEYDSFQNRKMQVHAPRSCRKDLISDNTEDLFSEEFTRDGELELDADLRVFGVLQVRMMIAK